jgi:3-oxoacyl-[acyl-carrier-protein] synthase I
LALTAASLWPRSRLLGPNWTRLPAHIGEHGAVAITIDDGPEPDVTPHVLALLDRHQAPATFFCIGERVSRYPELSREIVRRGHSIENHTQCHRHTFSLLGPGGMKSEISNNRHASQVFSRARRPAQPVSRSCVGTPRAEPRQLDSPWLRHRERRCGRRVPTFDESAAGRRHPAVARRPCGAPPRRIAGDPGGVAALARRVAGQELDARHFARSVAVTAAMTPLLLAQFTATSCLGSGLAPTLASLVEKRSGLKRCEFETVSIDTYIGEVPGVDAQSLPTPLRSFDCRNNRLAELALQQDGFFEAVQAAVLRWGRRRVGVFMGTSTAGILQTELAYRARDPISGALPASFEYGTTHNSFSVADYVRQRCGVEGPAVAVSAACASSAKVFAAARRMIESGLIDAALVGGTDSLCLTTLYGFHSLQLSSPAPCRPFDIARDGISIGEAAAFVLLERVPDNVDADAVLLLGAGESSDAYHMSAPHPEGLGAKRAMQAALAAASMQPGDVDYINLHGTGTPSNDRSETLGAAGALEAVISSLAIRHGLMPGGVHTTQIDPTLTALYIRDNRRTQVRRVLSNSFGFGGTNCSLIFGRAG